ncbi:MAG: hypothetical protein LBS74_04520 [Oscillospiraceae bacterium]|jgi:hypothetical protein|nr:hypothetical protein [Oscillospiraceae bacterium]
MNQIKQFMNPRNTAFWGCVVLVISVLAAGVLMAVHTLKVSPVNGGETSSAAVQASSHTLLTLEEQPLNFTSLKETDEWVLNNRHQILMPYDKGYCFNFAGNNGDGPAAWFCYSTGDGKYEKLLKPDEFYGKISINGAIYGAYTEQIEQENPFALDAEAGKQYWGKYENGKLTELKKVVLYDICYYTEEYIHFAEANTIYQRDYSGGMPSSVVNLGTASIINIAVYQGKLWCEYYDKNDEDRLMAYDLETEEIIEFEGLGLICINNGYVYVTKLLDLGADEDAFRLDLYRLNCETYKLEKVFEDCDYYDAQSIAFTDDLILYIQNEDIQRELVPNLNRDDTVPTLYSFDGKEKKTVFSGGNLEDGVYLNAVQVIDGKIFIESSGGAAYDCCDQIDVNGKILQNIYK